MKKLIFVTLLLSTQLFSFQRFSFGLNVNTDVVEFEGKLSMAPLMSDPVYRNFYADFNLINDNDTMFGAGVYVENSFYNYQPLSFQVGVRSVFSDHGGDNFIAIPIIFGFKHKFYAGNIPIGAVGAKVAYAPSPICFQDAQKYLETRVEATMQIIENVEIYAGYRNINTDYEEYPLNYSDSGYIGFRFIF